MMNSSRSSFSWRAVLAVLALLALASVLIWLLMMAYTASEQRPTDPPTVETPAPLVLELSPRQEDILHNKRAETVLSDLCATFPELDLTVQEDLPYLICVNRAASCVTVYAAGEDGKYSLPYMAMACSGGEDTPLGVYPTVIRYNWRLLSGNVYGQYATRIVGPYLFHSVPYYTEHQDDLEYDQFNQLGTPASLGCIRLAVVDVKWIFDNCPIGTTVVIYDDADMPGPMGKPVTLTLDPADADMRGWDPTDPNPDNPWGETYLDGTTIRSLAAAQAWEEFRTSEDFRATVTKSTLQGWSHDSAIVGTAG